VAGDVLDLRPVGVFQDARVDVPVVTHLLGVDQREVGVDAQAAVPRRVEDAQVLQHLFELFEERPHLAGARKSGWVTISISGVPARL